MYFRHFKDLYLLKTILKYRNKLRKTNLQDGIPLKIKRADVIIHISC